MATALKLRNDIKKLKAAIDSKKTPANFVPKLKAQLEKAENELAAMKKGGKPRKVSTTKSTGSTLQKLKSLVNKKGSKFSSYKGSGVDLEKDAAEGAMATGRRVSKGLKSNQYGDKKSNKGNVYYEYRVNRLDVKQPKKKQTYPKLASGGMMANGGEVDKELIDSSAKNIYEKKGMMGLRNSFLQVAKADEEAGDKKTAEYRRKVVSDYQSKQPKFMAEGGAVGKETIHLKSYNISGKEINSGDVIVDYTNETVQFPFGKTFKVENDRNYTIKLLKTKIKASGGIKGLADFIKEINTESSPFNPSFTNQFINGFDKYEDGGEVEEEEQKVIRGFSDDEPYEYAKGGITEHGLRIGDMIFESEENSVWVKNGGDEFMVNLNDGSRKKMEGKYRMSKSEMAHGGHVMSKTHRYDK